LFWLDHRLSGYEELIQYLREDPSFSKLITKKSDNSIDTLCEFINLSGEVDRISLLSFPQSIVNNSYDLMLLRGEESQDSLIECVKEVLGMIRNISEGKVIELPVFVGFNNMGIQDETTIVLDERSYLRSYKSLPYFLPNAVNNQSNLILEYLHSCEIKISNKTPDRTPTINSAIRKRLVILVEDISFILAMAINRAPPVGITQVWNLVFHPLDSGRSFSWMPNPDSPMPSYMIQDADKDAIVYWSQQIRKVNTDKIRIAIRRILSAINERRNPIDGFIDTIISWENLFGGNAELSYRISISIAKLLGKETEDRLVIQKEIVKYYTERSKIVHGVSEVNMENIREKRDECLAITLEVVKELYENHQKLLEDNDRSRVIALL